MKITGFKMARPEGMMSFKHKNTWKKIFNLFQNHLPQILEILYVAYYLLIQMRILGSKLDPFA